MPVEAIDHVQLAMPAGGERDARAFSTGLIDDEPLEGHDRVHVHDPFGNRPELLEPTA